jgi:hypothetical protein
MARPSRLVLIRDAAIFMLKLWLDGLKDITLTACAVVALVVDLFARRRADNYLFYRVVRFGEKFDLWLNLYATGPSWASSKN